MVGKSGWAVMMPLLTQRSIEIDQEVRYQTRWNGYVVVYLTILDVVKMSTKKHLLHKSIIDPEDSSY